MTKPKKIAIDDHHGGQHDQARQAGELGQRPARAIEHDGEQDAGKRQQDRGPRVPQADRKGEHADHGGGDLGGARHFGSAEPKPVLGALPRGIARWLAGHAVSLAGAHEAGPARVAWTPIYVKAAAEG